MRASPAALKQAIPQRREARTTYDTNMANADSAIRRSTWLWKEDRSVSIAYDVARPVESLKNGRFRITVKQETKYGRATGARLPSTCSLGISRAREAVEKVTQRYAKDKRVRFLIHRQRQQPQDGEPQPDTQFKDQTVKAPKPNSSESSKPVRGRTHQRKHLPGIQRPLTTSSPEALDEWRIWAKMVDGLKTHRRTILMIEKVLSFNSGARCQGGALYTGYHARSADPGGIAC